MKRVILSGVIGAGCLLSLTACVVQPAPPPPPPPAPVVMPAPVVVPPAVVARPHPRYWHRRCPRGWHPGRYGRRCFPNR